MHHDDAVALIRDGIDGPGGTWADLGSGSGVFTRALMQLLGENSRIYAMDRDAHAVAGIRNWARESAPNVVAVQGDFTDDHVLAGLPDALDGILVANALHFVPDAGQVLARLRGALRPGGRIVLVEYDRRAPSRWVPYPIPLGQLQRLAAAAGLSPPRVIGTRPSEYGGVLYAAAMDRPKAD